MDRDGASGGEEFPTLLEEELTSGQPADLRGERSEGLPRRKGDRSARGRGERREGVRMFGDGTGKTILKMTWGNDEVGESGDFVDNTGREGSSGSDMDMEEADILCLQETRWDDNLLNMSRKQWKGQIYVSEGTPRARGVAICFNSAKITGINLVHRDLEGRLLVVDCVYEGRELRIINLYAPNGEKERRVFLAGLNVWCNPNCMIVGDFNVILTRSDLRQLVANTLKQSRIDFVLVQSGNVKLIKSVEYINNTWSDHAGIRLEVGGRGGSVNQRP
uniref:exodeoxyribonuclease III n=1 Tax=Gadus morhua TaxID=8049 RepID=A0A8C5ACM8_GADMO